MTEVSTPWWRECKVAGARLSTQPLLTCQGRVGLAALVQLALLPREVALSAAKLALPLLVHPASFLRLGVIGLVCALADNLGKGMQPLWV